MGSPCFKAAEILLFEDNPADVTLLMEARKNVELRNNITMVNDGIHAIDFLSCREAYTSEPLKLPGM